MASEASRAQQGRMLTSRQKNSIYLYIVKDSLCQQNQETNKQKNPTHTHQTPLKYLLSSSTPSMAGVLKEVSEPSQVNALGSNDATTHRLSQPCPPVHFYCEIYDSQLLPVWTIGAQTPWSAQNSEPAVACPGCRRNQKPTLAGSVPWRLCLAQCLASERPIKGNRLKKVIIIGRVEQGSVEDVDSLPSSVRF